MATNNNHTHTDTATGKGGGALTENPAPSPGANPGDLASEQGSGNAKASEVTGSEHDPDEVASGMGTAGPGAR